MAEREVLVVDDDDSVRRVVCRLLEQAGIPAVEAADGETALGVLDSADVEVVVLDLHLPGISGLDVLRQVRADGRDAHVIVFTGAGDGGDREQAMAAGADDFLTKSAGRDALMDRIHAARGERRTGAARSDHRAEASSSVDEIAHDLQNVFTVIGGYSDLAVGTVQAASDGGALDIRALLDDLQLVRDASQRGAALLARLASGADPVEAPQVDGATAGGGELILIVEDDADLRRAAERILADAGYTVLSAGDTQTALALHRARRDEIALVLTDAIVPGSDPGAVAARLAAVDPDLPVILMSGYGPTLHDLVPGLAEDAHIVDKPFTREGLLGAIRHRLASSDR